MATKSRKKRKAPRMDLQRDDVTPERAAKGEFQSIGMARRLVPVIALLRQQGAEEERKGIRASERRGITQAEYDALAYYRDQASLAEKSPVRSCVDFSPRGGNGPGNAIISAQRETWRMDRDLGELQPICRAIAVDDLSLTQWCVQKHGGREKLSSGNVIEIMPRGRKSVELARLELRMAAGRIAR